MEDVPKNLPRVRSLVKTVKKVVKFITRNQRPLAIYKAKAKTMLQKPALTRYAFYACIMYVQGPRVNACRFATRFVMIESVLKEKAAVQHTANSIAWSRWVQRLTKADKKEKAAEVKAAINDGSMSGMWAQAQEFITVHAPIMTFMRLVDSNIPLTGKVYYHAYKVRVKSGVILWCMNICQHRCNNTLSACVMSWS